MATDTCQRWLATGALPRKPCIEISRAIEEAVPASMPFSFVYEALLRAEIESLLSSIASVAGQKIPELEGHSFDHWAAIHATPIEELQAICSIQIQRAKYAAVSLPKDQLRLFTKQLADLMDLYTEGKSKRRKDLALRRKEQEGERAILKEYLLLKLRKFLDRMIKAAENSEQAEAIAGKKIRRIVRARARL